MAAIRHTIQKEVFSPLEERLVGLVNVTKPGRKKKTSFLCASGEGRSLWHAISEGIVWAG